MSDKSKSPESEAGTAVEGQVENAADEAAEASEPTSVEELRQLLEEARGKADENWDKALRLQAELDNTQRRAQRDIESAHKYALEKFALELLPVKDSLELGLAAAQGSDHEVADKLREGTELTLKMLTSAMEKFGIAEVDPQGQPFNPECHQAMTMQPSSEHEANTIMAVMQKGYLLNERLLRPAMVVVSKGDEGSSGN